MVHTKAAGHNRELDLSEVTLAAFSTLILFYVNVSLWTALPHVTKMAVFHGNHDIPTFHPEVGSFTRAALKTNDCKKNICDLSET